MSDALVQLAERCEAATGPNFELEREIADAVWRAKWGRRRPKDISPQPCTASLDAAMTLVPEGAFWSITMRGERRGGYHACCQLEGGLDWREGATPALALTAAALRALAGGK